MRARARVRARVRVHVRVRALCHHNIISSLLTSQPPNISQVSGVERNHFLEWSESGLFSSSHCHVFTLKDQDQSEVLKYVMSSFSVWQITFYVIHITLLPGLLFKHCVPQKVPPPQFEYSWCSSVHNSPEFPFNIIYKKQEKKCSHCSSTWTNRGAAAAAGWDAIHQSQLFNGRDESRYDWEEAVSGKPSLEQEILIKEQVYTEKRRGGKERRLIGPRFRSRTEAHKSYI